MLGWELEVILFRFLNMSYLKYYFILFALFGCAHHNLHRLMLIYKQKNHSTELTSFLLGTDKLFPSLTPVIWIVLVPDWYHEIRLHTHIEKRAFILFLWYLLREATLLCAWPFQGSAGGLDGCFPDHLLQPLLHVRNQDGSRSQSNVEY